MEVRSVKKKYIEPTSTRACLAICSIVISSNGVLRSKASAPATICRTRIFPRDCAGVRRKNESFGYFLRDGFIYLYSLAGRRMIAQRSYRCETRINGGGFIPDIDIADNYPQSQGSQTDSSRINTPIMWTRKLHTG